MAQLAQAYLHLKPYSASRKKLQHLGQIAANLASEAAKRIYNGDVVLDVELEEGSLRTRITVIGAITLGTYGAVANYKSFKESVSELCEDARYYAVDVCDSFTVKAGASQEQIYHFERRTKTPGKLYRLAKRLERLENSVSTLSPKDVQHELAEARRELTALAKDLSPKELDGIQKKLVSKKLPPPSRWPAPSDSPPKVAVKNEEPLLFDERTSLMLPIENTNPNPRRLIYRDRIFVDAQLPGIGKVSPQNAVTLDLQTPSQGEDIP